MKHNTLIFGFAVFLYTLVTVIITWPLFFNMSSSVFSMPTGPVDGLSIIWDFWWQKFAYLKGLSGLHNTYVNAPEGVDLSTGIVIYFWLFYGKWMSVASNPVFAFNFINFLSFILSGLAMYALVYYLTKKSWISLLIGFIYAFCPYHLVHAMERNGLAAMQWLPLAMLYMFKSRYNPSLKNLFLYSVFITLNFYFEPHYGFFAMIVSVIYLSFLAVKFRTINRACLWATARATFISGILIFILMLPSYYQTLLNFINPPQSTQNLVALGFQRSISDAHLQSAKVLNYLLPYANHPVLGGVTKVFLDTPLYGRASLIQELTLFVGFFTLFFFFFAFRKRKIIQETLSQRDKEIFQFLFVLSVLSFLFSLPPYLNLGVVQVPFPSLLLHKLLPPVRAFARFGAYTLLSCMLIAGFAVHFFLNQKARGKKIVYMVLFFLIVSFEYLPIPPLKNYKLNQPLPSAFEWIASQPGDFIIAEYPLSRFNTYFQMTHQKRLFNSTRTDLVYQRKFNNAKDLFKPTALAELRRSGVKYLLIDRNEYKNIIGNGQVIGVLPDFGKIAGIRQVRKFKIYSIYEVLQGDSGHF